MKIICEHISRMKFDLSVGHFRARYHLYKTAFWKLTLYRCLTMLISLFLLESIGAYFVKNLYA